MNDGTVLRVDRYADNSELMLACRRLGYLDDDWHILDCTYGQGTWWRRWEPEGLVKHDLKLDGIDYRFLPEADGEFDAVCFDPPYVCPGGRVTSTIGGFNERYGLDYAPRTPSELQAYNNMGLRECLRVCRPGGYVLTKCQNYVSGGTLWDGTYKTRNAAELFGKRYPNYLADELIYLGEPGPQPERDGQQHARSNCSVLLVFKRIG